MNKELKAQWLTALRSGEYQQGTGVLRSGTGENAQYCCLGVLCDLVAKGGKGEWKTYEDSMGSVPLYFEFEDGEGLYNKSAAVLPGSVVRLTGLPDNDPFLETSQSLSNLNDEGATFAQIADIIEANF